MRENPDNHWMTLKRPTNQPGSLDTGPVSQISQWIYHEGAEIMGLSTKSDYEKVEFTVTDIGLILKTVWLCADLIPFTSPIQRVIFHALVLLFSFGYRQGMIIGMKYEEVVVAFVRDADGRRRLATTFTVNRNKLRANALEHAKGENFQFTTTFLPYSLFCLTHLVLVVGIHFNAFKAGYKSVDEILHRPNLENVDYIHLEWREDFLNKPIFPMSYTTFWRNLQRVLLVAGFSTMARLYAFRVGALIEYNKSLTQATRNFVASHTTKVYENNYQTKRVQADLSRTRFGPCAGGQTNEPLFEVMRDLSKQNDSGAPLEATPEQKLSIESRRDITDRRAALEAAKLSKDKGQISKAKSALDQRRRALYKLILLKSREDYFEQANKLRAEGKSTDELRQRSRPARHRCDHAPLDMGCLLTYWTGEAGFGNRSGTSEELVFDDKAEDRLEGAMVWLLHYAAENWTPLSLAVPISSTSAKKPKRRRVKAVEAVEAPKANRPETWVCLLCDESKPFARRHCLSRHNKTAHIDKGAFDQSFLCPRCTPSVEISSAIEWCDHVEKTHGKMYAPIVSSKLLAETRVPQTKKTPTRSTKRKREDEIPGMVVLDLSEKPQKKARTNDEEVSSMLLETLEGDDNSDYGEFYDLFLIVFGLCL
ncbi:hypothetical protein DFH94DRAFT_700934 [Russula ochroleuca]|uniref:Uncharacterized protein n=1 Tax=Russula ochroleuca TaxID=152965 RepID=A0A9P5MP80_9AGAM|nr:hypothetical protein DFH94DRAFT_787911 [Russula ochroleuca]KAF8486826.1 hypothetical protein DFH94DRAFT_700934 [Russula ochroleuca]